MAVNARKISSSIILQVESDVADDGSAIYSPRTISKVDPALSDDDAYAEYYDGREHSNMLPRATPKNTIEFIICS